MSSEETKRGRVRRLLINPLTADGFRKRVKTPDEDHHNFLDRVADTLAYMSDDGLRVLRQCMATKGDGSSKDFWPSFAAIVGWAEALESRPLDELPALLRWFASRAGPEALQADRHIAEYEYWRKFKRPPLLPEDRQKVAQRAAEWRDRAERIREHIARRGRPHWDDDQMWLDWYEQTDERVRALIEREAAA